MFRPLADGKGPSLLSASPVPDLAAAGYTDTEYAASGIADRLVGDGDTPPAEFTTRLVVRRPADAAAFNGCAVVEWLNVSSGSDAAPEYSYLAAELVRAGYAWVGVSAQYVGVEGGTGSVGVAAGEPPQSLSAKDPGRYGGLHHPVTPTATTSSARSDTRFVVITPERHRPRITRSPDSPSARCSRSANRNPRWP